MPPARAGIAALVAVAAWVAAGAAAGAHTEVLRADPQPGTVVEAPVDEVTLTFLDPVRPGAAIAVTDPTGEVVPGLSGTQLSDDGRVATVAFHPLQDPGAYVVDYTFTAQDGDTQTEAFRFRLEAGPGGGPDDAGGYRIDPSGVGSAAVVGVTVAGALAVALRRRREVGPDPS